MAIKCLTIFIRDYMSIISRAKKNLCRVISSYTLNYVHRKLRYIYCGYFKKLCTAFGAKIAPVTSDNFES